MAKPKNEGPHSKSMLGCQREPLKVFLRVAYDDHWGVVPCNCWRTMVRGSAYFSWVSRALLRSRLPSSLKLDGQLGYRLVSRGICSGARRAQGMSRRGSTAARTGGTGRGEGRWGVDSSNVPALALLVKLEADAGERLGAPSSLGTGLCVLIILIGVHFGHASHLRAPSTQNAGFPWRRRVLPPILQSHVAKRQLMLC